MNKDEERFLRIKRPDIFSQINQELTATHYPNVNLDTITYGSKKKIWWNCSKDSRHVWDAQINARTVDGKGCLVCAGYRVIAGINDLEFLNPVLASQWHPVLNNKLLPSEVTATTNKKAWWQCSVDPRHEWDARIKDRHYGHGCPVCDNKRIMKGINDFATYHPELLSEWSDELNGSLTPYNVSPSSAKKIWWICPKDERHIYRMSLNDRHNNHGCTVCPGRVVIQGVNDAATHYPHLLEDWHPTLNGDLALSDFSTMSFKLAWWICKVNPNHEWETPIYVRTGQNQGCPICTGTRIIPGLNDLATHNPKLASQWHPVFNDGTQPDEVAPYSSTKYWWQCEQDEGHVWEASVGNRNSRAKKIGTGCPHCIVYKAEKAFRDLFNEMTDLIFVDGKVPVKWSKRNFTQIDILNEENKICVEYDGLWSHGGKPPSPYSLEECIERDVRKTEALLAAGYKVIRIREARLPHLPLSDPNYFQITCKLREDRSLIVERCIEFMSLISAVKI
jgi:hypothetical protein